MNLRDILREFPVILPILYLLTSFIILWGFIIKVIEMLKKRKKHDDTEIVNKETLGKPKVANILIAIGFIVQLVLGIIRVLTIIE
jgi:UDP-N-acetylmuramyl pentapeptide phosphotransferase/UDP-N-acetylglucosamine-1-phosphate transferase